VFSALFFGYFLLLGLFIYNFLRGGGIINSIRNRLSYPHKNFLGIESPTHPELLYTHSKDLETLLIIIG